jgi:peptide/nickel transport system ATP-binding protein
MMKEILIETEKLNISFRSGDEVVSAVRDVRLVVETKKTLAIVGESGSGKTVSSLCLMGLLDKKSVIYESGNISLNSSITGKKLDESYKPGDDIFGTIRGVGIAMVFQEPMTSLNPVMTCGNQLIEMLMTHHKMDKKQAKKRCVELFKEVMLPDPELIPNKYPFELSGGQRQRVMIAMSISCNPKVLIADEPTTALDVTVQREILLLLRRLQETHGMAMIFITHDLGIVKEIADDVVVMRRGDVLETGNAYQVLNNPQHEYTRGLLACKPSHHHKGKKLPTISSLGELETSIENIVPPLKENPSCLVSVNELTKSYRVQRGLFQPQKEITAVNHVTFEILKGETIGLVGESGCGKTTLSRMMLGLIPPSDGSITFSVSGKTFTIDRSSKKMPSWLRKEVQIVFQDPYSALNPKHTIGYAITEAMLVSGVLDNQSQRKQRTIELLERVGLKAEHFNRYPHEFSGGQRQRIVIARALACEPSFIICDESVSALDVSVQAQVLNLLNDLKRDFGLTYLFISHDLNVVYYMSDRILVMQKGQIVESGHAQEIFFHPQNDYTRQLIAAVPGGF